MADNNPTPAPAQSQNAGTPSTTAASSSASASASSTGKAAPKRNPAFAAMGLPRLRLPSRNWLIFLSTVAAWTAAVTYDRLEARRARAKWCALVRELAREPLAPSALPRRLTVVLGAPPADGLMMAREHFHEHVRPVLVSAGLDWDVVEGRREGDIRAGLAERIRKKRRRAGEGGQPGDDGGEDVDVLLEEVRRRMGTVESEGVAGDLVIGRHAWKEYVRGLHEGWLGPLDELNKVEPVTSDMSTEVASLVPDQSDMGVAAPVVPPSETPESDPLMLQQASDDASPAFDSSSSDTPISSESGPELEKEEEASEEAPEESKPPPKRKQPPPFISPLQYPSATLASSCPPLLGPSSPIPFPHILGFLNTPVRIYRFLNKRRLADEIGRQVATAALGVHRPYEYSGADAGLVDSPSEFYSTPLGTSSLDGASEDRASKPVGVSGEQASVLENEEDEWHKSVRKRDGDEPGKERVWLDDVVLDPRIASRMQRFSLAPEEEARAEQLGEELRKERWRKVWNVPTRVVRGVGVVLGVVKQEKEKSPLETVGYWDEDS